MLRALGSASRHIPYETKGSVVYGHWVVRLVISHTRQEIDLLRAHWVLHLVILYTRQVVRFVAGIGFCVL